MKNASGPTTTAGNIDTKSGEKTRIHEAAYGVLMEMLSDIYANATEAVLREYSVNAWDEHRKHKVDRPVEVTLPSVLQPTLVVRDFAAGIPLDGVYEDIDGERVCVLRGAMEVFGEYGNSSKRDNNDEAGHFGIGSKAAFALGHQFVVSGFQDGRMFTVLFTLNEDGTGTKTVMAQDVPTDQPNGVEVSLGVDDVEYMRETAARFFSFWERGTVLVDGQEPTPIFESLERVNDDIFIDSDGRGEAYAVMGPVAYPVDRKLLGKVATYLKNSGLGEDAADLPTRLVDSSTDLYLKVPIGSVKPAPSRESLRDKESTVHTLGAVFLGLHQDSAVKIQNEVDQAPSFYAAAKALHQGNEHLGAFKVSRKTITWKGQSIKAVQPVEVTNYQLVQRSWRSTTKVVGEDGHANVEFPAVENFLVVTGVADDNQGVVRRYAKRFLEDNEQEITRIFVTSATSASFGWFQFGVPQGARTWTLEEWRAALKAMRKSNPRTVNEASYTTGFERASRDLDDRDLLSDIISEGKDLVLFRESAVRLDRFEREVLRDDFTVVVLLATQSENALRKRVEEDGSVSIVPWSTLKPLAQQAAQKVVNSFSDEEREALGAREWLSENQSARAKAKTLVTGLRVGGQLTAKTLLDIEDSFLLAEEFASGLTEERYAELSYAYRSTGQDMDADGIAYQDEVVDLDQTYPLLPYTRIREAVRNMRQYRKTAENGEVTYSTWYYSEEKYQRDLLMLEHAVSYVNGIG